MTTEHEERLALARKALDAYGRCDDETRIVDLLADLMHLCDQLNTDYHELEARAYNHYLGEREEA
jgi:hypothetical protein